ncbi:FadR/GntR family transcriptional regulator [Labrys monachus]|uniref:DNA-binding FadR family transcriptional regulator n=1 Tax=Labrys monachus TaxID=217067 RepID=A0ABU0FFA2_9HYPH|nr:FadR/GntR family transcriptional regulator [Labrys monachus]MDQ0392819.1 DNA-binding FadR family transcriptional regulator [Labrys monachus]
MKQLEPSPALSLNPAGDTRLPQLEPTRLYRQIARLLGSRIDDGTFPAGTLLPTERDLAQQLGVSRTSVREALIALEVSGKVSIRVGHGVQILKATPRREGIGAGADVNEADIGPIQLMEARRHIELKTVELAAANRTQANLEGLARAIGIQADAKSIRSPDYRAGDRSFHVEIAKASGNAVYVPIVGDLWDYRYKPMFEKFEELLMGPDRLGLTLAEHRHVFEAIADGDPVAARKAMKTHLDAVLRAFSRGLGAK